MNHPHPALTFATAAARHLGQCLWTFAAVAITATLPAKADSLPAPQTFAQCSADGNSSFDSTECQVGGIPGVPSSAFASAVLAPFPFVEVELSSPPAGVFGAGAGAQAFYAFQVTGGNVGDLVPLLIQTNLKAFSTLQSSSLARLIIHTSAAVDPLIEEVCSGGSCAKASFSDTLSIQARSGSAADSVILLAQGQAVATGSFSELARASADPYIYIDPAFPNASLYSVVVSAGVGNVPPSPVPEPASAVLLLAGGVLGWTWLKGGTSLLRRPAVATAAARRRRSA